MNGIGGVNAAALTPRGKKGDADFGAALEILDFLCGAGVRGILLFGSSGEFPGLSFDERTRLAYLAVKRSRAPLLVGVGHATLEGAVVLAREAACAGVAGVVLMPPYYYRYDQQDLFEFYVRFAEELGAGAPIYLYNVPAYTSPIQAETAGQLLATGRFAGIGDTSGSIEYFRALKELRAAHPFTLLTGGDVIFARTRAAGSDGCVSGLACAVPEIFLAIENAIQASNSAEADRLDAQLQELLGWINRFPRPAGARLAAGFRGLKTGSLTVPLPPEKQKCAEEFREWFLGWLPAIQRTAAHR